MWATKKKVLNSFSTKILLPKSFSRIHVGKRIFILYNVVQNMYLAIHNPLFLDVLITKGLFSRRRRANQKSKNLTPPHTFSVWFCSCTLAHTHTIILNLDWEMKFMNFALVRCKAKNLRAHTSISYIAYAHNDIYVIWRNFQCETRVCVSCGEGLWHVICYTRVYCVLRSTITTRPTSISIIYTDIYFCYQKRQNSILVWDF